MISRLVGLCNLAGISYKIVPGVYDFLTGRATVASPIRNVRFEDIIRRRPAEIDMNAVKSFIAGKRVLITGAAGSIGSEMVVALNRLQPEKIMALDVNENTMMSLLWEIRDGGELKKERIFPVIADICDPVRMDRIFADFRPDVVYHAAARKHVPLMELFPEEAVETNVLGTYNLLRNAEKHGINDFFLISTGKAVNPSNVMGATKRLAELLIKEFSYGGELNAGCVWFGNVLGSAGSVIPLFKKQIENGGPVTVTDPEIQRFFMTIPEAVSLVIQSSAFEENGQTYVPEVGEQMKILEIAENMIKIAGYEPYTDIDITFTGLRPGEKMYEELYYAYEKKHTTANPGIFRIESEKRWKSYEEDMSIFKEQIEKLDRNNLIRKIMEIVPEFRAEKSSFEEKVEGLV